MAIDKVWVLAEATDGKVSGLTQELLSKARQLGGTVEAFTWGDASGMAEQFGTFGATKVYSCGDIGAALPGVPVAAAIAAQIEGGNTPDAIFVGMTYDGRDVVGRLSAKLDKPVLTNVVELTADDGGLTAGHAVFGGATIVKAKLTGAAPHIFIVRPKSFAAEESGGGPAEVVTVESPDAGATNAAVVVERHVEAHSGPKLDEAAVVVSGGRGIGEAEKFSMVEDLAKLLKGAAGASRAIVDAGWVPYSYQVGQTGKTVKPTVYIACGISGATQHMVGMKGAKNIVAINKDQEAPIFSIADLGIVGDANKVVPALIEAIKSRG